MSDPYKVLGVSPDASDDEIKKLIGLWRESTIPTNTATATLPTLQAKR